MSGGNVTVRAKSLPAMRDASDEQLCRARVERGGRRSAAERAASYQRARLDIASSQLLQPEPMP